MNTTQTLENIAASQEDAMKKHSDVSGARPVSSIMSHDFAVVRGTLDVVLLTKFLLERSITCAAVSDEHRERDGNGHHAHHGSVGAGAMRFTRGAGFVGMRLVTGSETAGSCFARSSRSSSSSCSMRWCTWPSSSR